MESSTPSQIPHLSCLQLYITITSKPMMPFEEEKSRIRETPTLSACADSRTNTMKSRLFDAFLLFCHFLAFFFAFLALFVTLLALFCLKIMSQLSRVIFYMSHVICQMSHVTFLTNANSNRPSPADSPIIDSRLVPDPKKP